jgi:hypothetical protein
VITNIDAQNNDVPNTWYLVTVGPIALVFSIFPVTNAKEHLAVKGIAYQGETIALTITGGAIDVNVSGSLLADDTGHTGPPLGAASKPIEPDPPRVVPS